MEHSYQPHHKRVCLSDSSLYLMKNAKSSWKHNKYAYKMYTMQCWVAGWRERNEEKYNGLNKGICIHFIPRFHAYCIAYCSTVRAYFCVYIMFCQSLSWYYYSLAMFQLLPLNHQYYFLGCLKVKHLLHMLHINNSINVSLTSIFPTKCLQ